MSLGRPFMLRQAQHERGLDTGRSYNPFAPGSSLGQALSLSKGNKRQRKDRKQPFNHFGFFQEHENMKIKASKPRNPLVPALCQRNGGGVHQKSGKALRQAARQALLRSLKRGEGSFVQHCLVQC